MNARSISYLLYLVAKLRPEAWDAIHPQGPVLSTASREYLIAMAAKSFQAELSAHVDASALTGVQKTLVQFASGRLAADFDDDNWCLTPPIPIRWPHFGFSVDEVALNPQPLPPKQAQREIGGYLMMLAEATTVGDAAKELGSVARRLLNVNLGPKTALAG